MWPLALLLLGAADPCAMPEAGPADLAAAAIYRTVGDEARGQGQLGEAGIAYRQAIALGLNDANLAQDYLAACQSKTPEALLDEGLTALRQGDRQTALARFLQVQRIRPDANAALLEGICRYEDGDDAGARPALERAAKDPALNASAQLFLGLVALREGEEGEAAARFEDARADTSLSARGLELARIARQHGPLVLSATLEGALDSNLDLSPEGGPQGSDAGLNLSALARVQPWGMNGPFLRVGAVLSRQRTLTALNLLGADGAAGLQFARGNDYLLAEYEYRRTALGGDDYLSTHRVHAFAQKGFGRLLFDASYGAEYRDYQQATNADYTGWYQRGALETGFGGKTLTLLGGYALGRDGVPKDTLAAWEHGPLLEARLRPDSVWRLNAELSAAFRRYDAADPAFGVAPQYLKRDETRWTAAASAALDLGLHWTALLALSAERNLSNVADFTYSAFSATLGLQFTLGVAP